ncbi:MAG TPA: hypothetical protein VMZ27_02170 [Candidatus Saccharimonadales bacterium]|nr:hypothetical protein [Candidatus Saccharimonadales bacterium]
MTAPTAAIVAKSNPSAEGKALLKPDMTPGEYLHTLKENKLAVDSVHFIAHGLPEMDAICWACQGCRLVMPKLSLPELDALKFTELWLKNPLPDLLLSLSLCLGKVDFTGPGGWCAQAGLWVKLPGMPVLPPIPGLPVVGLVAAAVIGAILLSAGLRVGVAMPPIPKPKLELPMLPLPPELLLKLALPPIPLPPLPLLDQPKLMKLLLPFIELGIAIAIGKVTCR